MNERLLTPAELAALTAEETSAHRLWTGPDGWVERFGEDYLVSAPSDAAARTLAARLPGWLAELGLPAARTFVRRLVKQPGGDDKPVQIAGPERSPEAIVTERGLRFGVDFSAGYSVGLFCDQRANRAFLESLRPQRVLNGFAYTAAFSVAAARAGAETLSLDLSRRALDRGRANFALNHLPTDGHRFLADDVFAVLPRLRRRGERFDAVILDPPTFSRGARGRIFRAEQDLGSLLAETLALVEPGGHLLLSTNARGLEAAAVARAAGAGRVTVVPPPAEYPPGAASSTAWLTIR